MLIDFKSSKGAIPSKTFYASEENAVPDFQMPLYLYLMEHAPKGRKKVVENCAFFNIADAQTVPVTGPLLKKNLDVDFEKTKESALELIDEYCARIAAHDFTVDSRVQDFSTCQACAYKSVCRRTFSVSDGFRQ